VLALIAKEREAEAEMHLMGRKERRAVLASIVRTTLSDVADHDGGKLDGLSPQQERAIRKVKVVEGKDGVTREIEMYDPIAAARLDAELTGDLARGGVAVQVNIGSVEPMGARVARLMASADAD
jgi:hypothetical protein